jgi:hypothetical protein
MILHYGIFIHPPTENTMMKIFSKNNLIKLTTTATIGLIVSGAALAGQKIAVPVIVTDTTFSGSIGSARNSNDNQQFLACYFGSAVSFCTARDESGRIGSCIIPPDDQAFDSLQTMTDSSYFRIDHESGQCTEFLVGNSSEFEPK